MKLIMINPSVESKYDSLKKIFKDMDRVIIAYSGGIDSTLLLKVGTDVLGVHCLGLIGESPSLASSEYHGAISIAKSIGARVEIVKTNEMNNDHYLKNDDRRCFYCKSELFDKIHRIAADRGYKYIIDGNNLDDKSDYRPGMEAAQVAHIRSPLIESGFTKSDIRELGHHLNLPNWDKPAQPCLSSRIAYGIKVTPDILKNIELAESLIKQMNFKLVRVRYMGDHVSVEVGPDEVSRLLSADISKKILHDLKNIGFSLVYLDKEGYVSGKLNRSHLAIK